MTNILEHNSKHEDQTILVGDKNEEHHVSLKAYQDIYHQITGKTEEISKRYRDSICLEYSDLEELNIKIEQICDIYTVVALTTTVTIYHEKERKEIFTSFDRFRKYNSSSVSPTNSILLKYNFSILPSRLNKTQEYVVTIRLTSRVSTLRELERESHPFMRGSYTYMMSSDTMEVTVQYVDYIIARTFMEATDEWLEGLNKTEENKIIKSIQGRTEYISIYGKLIIATVCSYFLYISVGKLLQIDNNIILTKLFIVSIMGIYSILTISNIIFSKISDNINYSTALSYLKLNKGDNKIISEYKSKNNKKIFYFLLNAILAIILGVIASLISTVVNKIT